MAHQSGSTRPHCHLHTTECARPTMLAKVPTAADSWPAMQITCVIVVRRQGRHPSHKLAHVVCCLSCTKSNGGLQEEHLEWPLYWHKSTCIRTMWWSWSSPPGVQWRQTSAAEVERSTLRWPGHCWPPQAAAPAAAPSAAAAAVPTLHLPRGRPRRAHCCPSWRAVEHCCCAGQRSRPGSPPAVATAPQVPQVFFPSVASYSVGGWQVLRRFPPLPRPTPCRSGELTALPRCAERLGFY